jgi:hypothetical protein
LVLIKELAGQLMAGPPVLQIVLLVEDGRQVRFKRGFLSSQVNVFRRH